MFSSDASFAGDIEDSKSTSGAFLALAGPNTFVPITWFCKKQGAVSHSSTEAEIISLDAGLRLEGVPTLGIWDEILEYLCPGSSPTRGGTPSGKFGKQRVTSSSKAQGKPTAGDLVPCQMNNCDIYSILSSIDYVAPSLPSYPHQSRITIMEDNEAVIKMVIKGRSPTLRHVARTHRIDLDWIFEV